MVANTATRRCPLAAIIAFFAVARRGTNGVHDAFPSLGWSRRAVAGAHSMHPPCTPDVAPNTSRRHHTSLPIQRGAYRYRFAPPLPCASSPLCHRHARLPCPMCHRETHCHRLLRTIALLPTHCHLMRVVRPVGRTCPRMHVPRVVWSANFLGRRPKFICVTLILQFAHWSFGEIKE